MNIQTKELVRYGINGFLATLIHYAVLTINLNIFLMSSAGMANLIASIFGITFSFLGNRYFVFSETNYSFFKQAITFSGLYGAIAILHGVVLFFWTDWLGFDYRIGFLMATFLQMTLSYLGNKKIVFNRKKLENFSEVNTPYIYSGNELEVFLSASNWKAYWSDVIRPFLGDQVLELGAGIGATITVLNHKRYQKWVAVEPDKAMCSVLEKKNVNGEFGLGFKVVNGTSASLNVENTFDTILYIDVLEHIENDLNELEHIQSYLVEGGHIIIVAPAHNFLYTSFDKKIGHYRRYNKRMLQSLVPSNMVIKKIHYIDSVGLLASLANKLFLKTDTPTYKQVQLWDKYMVKTSRWVDGMIRHLVGKSIVCILEKRNAIKGTCN